MNTLNSNEIDLTVHAYLVEEENSANQARRFHEAEAKRYGRIRDAARARLDKLMGVHTVGVVNGVQVIRKTLSDQFAHARFRNRYPQLYADYLVPKLEYVLDMDRLNKELPQIVAEFSTLRWTNNSDVLDQS